MTAAAYELGCTTHGLVPSQEAMAYVCTELDTKIVPKCMVDEKHHAWQGAEACQMLKTLFAELDAAKPAQPEDADDSDVSSVSEDDR